MGENAQQLITGSSPQKNPLTPPMVTKRMKSFKNNNNNNKKKHNPELESPEQIVLLDINNGELFLEKKCSFVALSLQL